MKERIYSDYIMGNRYKEYEEFLKLFLKYDYKFICVKDYELLNDNDNKYIVLRHDIDSDIKIAKKMFEIEKKLNIKSTYYFRLCTIDTEFIREIYDYGSEVGYHYEEIAQYCKDHNVISKEFVINNIDDIKTCMIKNIKKFEDDTNVKIYSIASHGDFINRKINIPNKYLYQDDIKQKLKLIEAYDIENLIDFRTADTMYPKFWKRDIKEAINQKSKNVLVLVHPRWWNSSPLIRARLDIQRIIDEIKYCRKGE